MAGFLGMRGTGDWATDERPKAWREAILFLYPNGDAPLTAILSKMGEEKVSDPEFNWWTKTLPAQAGAITAIYTDFAMSSVYTSGGVAGQIVYVKVAEAVADEFRVGHQVLLRDSSNYTVDVNAKVLAVNKNGALSCITVRLLEADDNGSNSNDLSDADRILIIGNINPEGAYMPTGISYNPTKYNNYTQILRTPLSITRTARETKYRTGDKYKEMKREALELHGIEMEKAFIFGIPTEGTGDNGKPERTTGGIRHFIKTNVPNNASSFALSSTYAGKDWTDADGGRHWLDTLLEQVFRYGSGEKFALCGSGALLGIQRLVEAGAHMNITPMTTSYGLKVREWLTPFGTLYMKTAPLLSHEPSTRNGMLIIEPKNLKYRFITDTKFYGEGESATSSAGNNSNRKDGTDEEFLTECGLEMHHPDTMMLLEDIGQDNRLTP